MPGFLYYLPGATPADVQVPSLRGRGLGYAFDRAVTANEVRTGPAGSSKQPGIIVADSARVPPEKTGLYPGQTWRKMPQSPIPNPQSLETWVGCYEGDLRPAPEDLARRQQVAGDLVELGDGRKWLVPMARRFDAEGQPGFVCQLPQAVAMDEQGQWGVGDVRPAYRELWDTGMAWFDARMGVLTGKPAEEVLAAGHVDLDFQGAFSAAVRTLAVNYVLGPVEISLLGLFTTDSARMILDSLCDYETFLAWAQKKMTDIAEGGGPSTSPGSADCIPATGPP